MGCYRLLGLVFQARLRYVTVLRHMVSRGLLAVGYLAVPFAGPGAAVVTAAGWLALGVETREQLWTGIGLVGVLGVAGILAATHSPVLAGLAPAGGLALLLYLALAVVGLWIVGGRTSNWLLKAAAAAFALSWLFAVVGAGSTVSAAAAASGGVIDWAGTSWASEAAMSAIQAIGGPVALAKGLATLGGVLAGLGFIAGGGSHARAGFEEQLAALASTY